MLLVSLLLLWLAIAKKFEPLLLLPIGFGGLLSNIPEAGMALTALESLRTPVTAPLAGNIWKVIATEGQTVAEGDVLLILEAMKMETEIRAAQAGTVRGIAVKSGDAVSVGDTLMTLA
ncbi:sodium ion-translocating decarboxylase subunit beta [Salmonella enterica]|uniref:sodium ion-translocating decarboxylase subunit beta n=1 Tax=Salmonella enterica TaxID=28901 RepID=UPI003AF329B2